MLRFLAFLSNMRSARTSSLLATFFGIHRLKVAFAGQSTTNLTLRQFESEQLISFPSNGINMTRLAPIVSLSHGGGPMPILGDPSHASIVKSLRTKVPQILKLGTVDQPRAIVLVTAHWSTDKVTISSSSKHDLFYDYYGFPPEAYQLKYDAPGSPEVADLVGKALQAAGIDYEKDVERGM